MKKFLFLSSIVFGLFSCDMPNQPQQKSDSGVQKATVKIKTDDNGNTVEQLNVQKRLIRDNEPNVIKHLYVISAYTGNVLEYYRIKGKVTSGGKRLSPKTVNGNGYENPGNHNMVTINGVQYSTNEVLDDGGTYGESSNYVFWFDADTDDYHQHFPSGGTYLHISSTKLKIKNDKMIFANQN